MAKLTGAACRAGRALLKWSMRQLVEDSGVSLPTVLKLENDGAVTEETAEKVRSAFERHGVEITNGDGTGARLRLPSQK
jgi:transcriptional regulator with XRE-family HTH domain